MIEWVPTYESLYDAEKLGLRHTARSVYTGLCIKARKDLGDRVRLPRGRDLVTGVHQLLGGAIEEVANALQTDPCGLLYGKDPMIAVEGEEGALVVVVLRRERWALGGDVDTPPPSTTLAPAPLDARTRRRLADTERKRAARRLAKSGQPADTGADATADMCGQPADTGVGRDADNRRGQPADGVRLPEIVSAASLLRDVRRHDMLATLHGDTSWAERVVGGLIASACRAVDAEAAVDAFVTKRAAKAPPDGPALDAFVREHIGGFLKDAKRHGDEARARRPAAAPPPSTPPDVVATIEIFAEVWAARKKRPFVQAAGDEKHAASLVEAAREHAEKLKARPRDLVRHWAEQYLRDEDRFVADREHPLALLPSRLTQYGLPAPPRKERPSEPRSVEPPAVPPGNLSAELEAAKAAQKASGKLVRPGTRPL